MRFCHLQNFAILIPRNRLYSNIRSSEIYNLNQGYKN